MFYTSVLYKRIFRVQVTNTKSLEYAQEKKISQGSVRSTYNNH